MRTFLIFLILASFAGCSSTNSKRTFASEKEELKLDDSYNWVESLDFDKKVETKYKPEKDEFDVKKVDKETVLIKESISTLSSPTIEENLKESEDPLVRIVGKCYQGKFEEANVVIDQIYSQFKNNTSYWNQVATCYYLKGDYSKAILFYNKSRDLDPKFVPPLNNLGVVYQKQGRFQKALAAYKKANDMNAFSVTPAFNLARLYLQFGIIAKAEPIIVGLNKKNDSDPNLLNSLAHVYLLKNEYENAVATFKLLPKEFLTKPEVAINYALSLKMLNKMDDAKSVLSGINEPTGELRAYFQKVDSFIKE